MKKERHWVLPAIWAILLMLLLGGAVWAYHAFSVADWQSLDPSRLTSLAQTGAIHDKNGDYVTSLVGKENRTVIDTSRLPAHVVNAFLAAEDLRFYKHPGFDITRIIGAMLTNVRDGAFSQGASTISQQLIKLSHLSSQKTIARKLEEIHLALQLEKQYTKDEILDMYLNFIYFGQGAYGVQAAAEVTFGVDAAELTPAQAASLAAAIKAPSAYSLQSAPESNRERREYILSIMLEENMLTQAEYDAAMAEELTARSAPQVQTDYGWFVDAVLDEAESRLDVSAETLLAGGYRIDTTLDPDMQRIMDEQYLTRRQQGRHARAGSIRRGGHEQRGSARHCRWTQVRHPPRIEPRDPAAPSARQCAQAAGGLCPRDRIRRMDVCQRNSRCANRFRHLQAAQRGQCLLRERDRPHGAQKQPEHPRREGAASHWRPDCAALSAKRRH